eukprot:COSAG05_NODE_1609_length_4412_cov_2.348018_4_plen_284_part_00
MVNNDPSQQFTIKSLNPDLQAAAITHPRKLEPGMLLHRVRRMPVQGKPFSVVMGMIKNGARPITLTFLAPPASSKPEASDQPANPFMKKVADSASASKPSQPSRVPAPTPAVHALPAAPVAEVAQWHGQRVILVDVLRARHLRKADRFGAGADPYVVLKCGGQTQRTKVVKSSLAPTWLNASFEVKDVDDVRGTELHFEVWDEDKGSSDDLLGRASLAVSAITGQEQVTENPFMLAAVKIVSCYPCTVNMDTHRACERLIRTCTVFLDRVQNLQIHAVRAKFY